jgi:copper chaperone NosL
MLEFVRRYRRPIVVLAAVLVAAAIFLPLWGMTLVSTQYPEGLRMVVYPTTIRGDIREINALNHYIGMTPIADDFFTELRLLPLAFAVTAVAALLASFIRRAWATALPLACMALLAGYGFWSMQRRLYQFGHDLDPMAAIDITPFTPPMLGENQIAQFASYSYFSWGTILPMIAGVLLTAVLLADLRPRAPLAPRATAALAA